MSGGSPFNCSDRFRNRRVTVNTHSDPREAEAANTDQSK